LNQSSNTTPFYQTNAPPTAQLGRAIIVTMISTLKSITARAYAATKAFAKRIKRQLAIWQSVLRHPRTGRVPKALLWFAIGYALMPFDLIPDFIPILGWLDDLILVAVPIVIAIKLVPADILAECRAANPPPLSDCQADTPV
jgi:uncharacterized membrane protein YkvA (DUF1232 family)